MKRMKGIITAVLTPFTKEGEIDKEALKANINFLVESGVNGLYVLGSTGEAFLMNLEERKLVLELALEYVANRIPIFAQIGCIPTENACELGIHAKEAGAAGIGAITPIYHHASQYEMKEYYIEIASSVGDDYPVYLYNLPSCSGNDLLPETVGELAREVENIVGVKNSMNDMGRLCSLVDLTPEKFDVIQGCDTLIYPAMLYGAKGAVTGISNVFPEIFVKLYRVILDKDYVQAKEIQKVVNIVTETLQFGANLACLKKALKFRGFKPIYTRKPLLDMEEDEANKLEKDIKLITDKYL